MAVASGTYSAKKVQAILSSRDDWRTWYRVVKDHAIEKGVWEYFDPDADDETRPDLPAKPKAPLEDEVSEGAYRRYLVATHEWQAASSGIQSTNELIRETVALHIQELIAEKGTYEMLRTLKKQYAPTDQEERLKALRKILKMLIWLFGDAIFQKAMMKMSSCSFWRLYRQYPILLRKGTQTSNTEQFKSTTSSMAFATFRGQNDDASSSTESNTK